MYETEYKEEADASALAAAQAAVQRASQFFLIEQQRSANDGLEIRISELVKKYPSQRASFNPMLEALKSLGVITESNYSLAEKTRWRSEGQVDLLEKKLQNTKATITCVKGKLTKKVTATKPICPSGYKKK